MVWYLACSLTLLSVSCRANVFLRVERTTNAECVGRDQSKMWIIGNSGTRRLKGPVINIHINTHAGRFLYGRAKANGMKGIAFARWWTVNKASQGEDVGGKYFGDPGFKLWEDGSWTDLEDTFGIQEGSVNGSAPRDTHSLDELGCNRNAAILAISMRHPIGLLLSQGHPGHPEGWDVGCEFDNVALRLMVGKTCGGLAGGTVKDCAPLTKDDLELAKARARQMDLIFIVEHLSATIKLGCSRLGWTNCDMTQHEPYVLNDNVRKLTPENWEKLLERNKLGIELFEYMRDLSFQMLRADGLPVPTDKEAADAVIHEMPMPSCPICKHSFAIDRIHERKSKLEWQCGPR